MYLGTILVTGFLLLDPWAIGFADRLIDWAILAKLGSLVLLTGLLSYVHLGIQPRIEALLAGVTPDSLVPEERRPALVRLRLRRKRISSLCLFLVVTAFIMGVQASMRYSPWLALPLMAFAVLFAWRVYRRPIPWGWV